MKIIKKILVFLLLVSLFGCKSNDLNGPYKVDRVVDGDTIVIYINDERVRVRALCIDTPESVAPEDSNKKNTTEGEIASNRAKELLENKSIYIEYDVEKYDQYDRLLAYIYLENKESYEEIMLSEGLAKVVVYEPNKKYAEHYYTIENEARKNNVGFYQTGFYK